MVKKKIRVNLVLDEDFYRGLQANAEEEFLSTGTWVRQYLQKNVNRDKKNKNDKSENHDDENNSIKNSDHV